MAGKLATRQQKLLKWLAPQGFRFCWCPGWSTSDFAIYRPSTAVPGIVERLVVEFDKHMNWGYTNAYVTITPYTGPYQFTKRLPIHHPNEDRDKHTVRLRGEREATQYLQYIAGVAPELCESAASEHGQRLLADTAAIRSVVETYYGKLRSEFAEPETDYLEYQLRKRLSLDDARIADHMNVLSSHGGLNHRSPSYRNSMHDVATLTLVRYVDEMEPEIRTAFDFPFDKSSIVGDRLQLLTDRLHGEVLERERG